MPRVRVPAELQALVHGPQGLLLLCLLLRDLGLTVTPDWSYDDYLELVKQATHDHPSWRYGQALFNVLWGIKPELCNLARDEGYDPFYADHRHEPMRRMIINGFLELVRANW